MATTLQSFHSVTAPKGRNPENIQILTQTHCVQDTWDTQFYGAYKRLSNTTRKTRQKTANVTSGIHQTSAKADAQKGQQPVPTKHSKIKRTSKKRLLRLQTNQPKYQTGQQKIKTGTSEPSPIHQAAENIQLTAYHKTSLWRRSTKNRITQHLN